MIIVKPKPEFYEIARTGFPALNARRNVYLLRVLIGLSAFDSISWD